MRGSTESTVKMEIPHQRMENPQRRGVKRKWAEVDDEEYEKQRNMMYDTLNKKFHAAPPAGKEVPLIRSVLIRESIRHIECEWVHEGMERARRASEAAIQIPEMTMAHLTLDPVPNANSFPFPLPPGSPMPACMEVSHGVGSEQGDYASLANSLVDSLTESGIVDLLPCQPVMGVQEGQVSQGSLLPSSPPPMYCNLQPPASPSTSSAAFPESSYVYPVPAALESTDELHAIDVPSLPASAYDGMAMDITPSLPPFSSWAPNLLVQELQKVFEDGDNNNNSNTPTLLPYNDSVGSNFVGEEVGPSDWTELSEVDVLDLIQTLQQKQEASSAADSAGTPAPTPGSSSPSSSSASGLNAQCSTSCRSDSAVDELDSIMQVIVGI